MIIDKSIKEFIQELKSEAPTPGGGGVAALNSAEGAALIMMVANLTVNNEKYLQWHEINNAALKELEEILVDLTAGVDADAEAFGKVASAYSMPKSSDEEKDKRRDEITKASFEAAEAPLKVMETSVRALEIDKQLLGNSNPNLKSDLLVAALSLQSGLLSAKYNVDANIPAIERSNSDYAEEIKNKSEILIEKGSKLVQEIV